MKNSYKISKGTNLNKDKLKIYDNIYTKKRTVQYVDP